jgi:predicted RNase H-like HicB family nuclease
MSITDRSWDALYGSPGHTFETHKQPDGSYTVTSPTIEGKVWKGETEFEAISEATREAYDMATKGEL